MSGVSLLFTREFFQLAADRLGERGVFCQWLHLYQVGPGDVRTLVGTLTDVFPRVVAFADGSDLLLVASRSAAPARPPGLAAARRREPRGSGVAGRGEPADRRRDRRAALSPTSGVSSPGRPERPVTPTTGRSSSSRPPATSPPTTRRRSSPPSSPPARRQDRSRSAPPASSEIGPRDSSSANQHSRESAGRQLPSRPQSPSGACCPECPEAHRSRRRRRLSSQGCRAAIPVQARVATA